MKNNNIFISGMVTGNFTYNHETHGEKFYRGSVSVRRNSGTEDVLQVVLSEHLLDTNSDYSGKFLLISGEYRSRNIHADKISSLDLFVFGSSVEELDADVSTNSIALYGFICKKPVYRKTPLGREICDLLVAVNGSFGRSYYIPCIAWGRNAIMASRFKIGDKVGIDGRIQSREYQKKQEDGSFETRVAYEVSACKIELVEEDK